MRIRLYNKREKTGNLKQASMLASVTYCPLLFPSLSRRVRKKGRWREQRGRTNCAAPRASPRAGPFSAPGVLKPWARRSRPSPHCSQRRRKGKGQESSSGSKMHVLSKLRGERTPSHCCVRLPPGRGSHAPQSALISTPLPSQVNGTCTLSRNRREKRSVHSNSAERIQALSLAPDSVSEATQPFTSASRQLKSRPNRRGKT